ETPHRRFRRWGVSYPLLQLPDCVDEVADGQTVMDIQKGCWMPASGWGLHRAIGDGDMPLISTDHEIASGRARGSQWTRAFGDRKEEDSFLSDARDRHCFRRHNAAVR